jgi:hypothetical protein
VTGVPVGPSHLGLTAGAGLELFSETGYLLPQREAAWALLRERLEEPAGFCNLVRAGAPQLAGPRDWVRRALADLAGRLQPGR